MQAAFCVLWLNDFRDQGSITRGPSAGSPQREAEFFLLLLVLDVAEQEGAGTSVRILQQNRFVFYASAQNRWR